mgnify:CR=1 FL=1
MYACVLVRHSLLLDFDLDADCLSEEVTGTLCFVHLPTYFVGSWIVGSGKFDGPRTNLAGFYFLTRLCLDLGWGSRILGIILV